IVRRRISPSQVRTLTDMPEHSEGQLESVLGASPHEFESRILRISEQEKRRVGTSRVPALLIF
ncbi:MAG: hypothetical protein JWN52_1966, partial [Actinomycetia bacterium]|nr:hypothetical protein [Actinomycetes bacterium]